MRILWLFLLSLATAPLPAVSVGDRAPDFVFTKTWNMESSATGLSELSGKLVLVEFWATWCPPCVANVPHLNEIHAAYAPKGLAVVAVSDETEGTIAGFIARQGMRYGVAQSSLAAARYGISGIPHAFLVDAEGKIAWDGHPADLDSSTLDQVLAGTYKPSDKTIQKIASLSAIILVSFGIWYFFNRRKPRLPPTMGGLPQ